MKIGRKQFLNHTLSGFLTTFSFPFFSLSKNIWKGIYPSLTRASNEKDFWEMVRTQFPLTDKKVYLNSGGLSPASYRVLDTAARIGMELQRMSETGHAYIEASREPIAFFLGVKAEEICFVRNATEGNSIVAAGLSLSKGDEVIFESHAHPGGSFPWLNRQKKQGIKVKIFEPDPISKKGNLERINKLITKRTRVIQVSHITAPTGILFPVKEIAKLAHDRGIWFHIDGAQSAGMIPVNLREIGCDSYTTSGHKWLGGPHETGVLYIQKEKLDYVAPVEVGAYSDNGYSLPDKFIYHPTARRYEYGTRNAASVVGLEEAIHFMEKIGMNRVYSYGHGLASYLQEQLGKLDSIEVLTPSNPEMHGSMTTFKSNRVPYIKLNRFLTDNYRLRCRIVSEQNLNAIRVSTHIFNNREDCDRVIKGVKAALK